MNKNEVTNESISGFTRNAVIGIITVSYTHLDVYKRQAYDDATLYKWLRNFYWRFFTQQFKRSCLPDGPKVGTVSLSPSCLLYTSRCV